METLPDVSPYLTGSDWRHRFSPFFRRKERRKREGRYGRGGKGREDKGGEGRGRGWGWKVEYMWVVYTRFVTVDIVTRTVTTRFLFLSQESDPLHPRSPISEVGRSVLCCTWLQNTLYTHVHTRTHQSHWTPRTPRRYTEKLNKNSPSLSSRWSPQVFHGVITHTQNNRVARVLSLRLLRKKLPRRNDPVVLK